MSACASIARAGCARTTPPTGSPGSELAWVDEFIRRVRPFIFVRAEDRLLIKRPNQAQKLNATGVRILGALLDGSSIDAVLERVGRDPVKVRQIGLFLREVKRWLEGNLTQANATPAVEFQPLPLHFSSLPVLSEVALTYRCNLRCRFCYAGCNCSENPAHDDREMSTEEVRGVLHAIRHEAQVPSVSFTGGEPTLRPDLLDLIRHAKDLGLRVNLVTNGTRIDGPLAGRLAEAGLDSAQVSLEGVTVGMHDRVTGQAGSFVRSVAAVGHLAAAGLRVHTNTTIHRTNLDECPRFPAFVRNALGRDRFSMNLVIPTGSAIRHAGLAVGYREIGPVLEAILAASQREGVEFMWYSPTPICLFNPIPRGLGNKGCAACDGLLSVAPNGAVLPCASFDDPVGNLLTQSFREIWSSGPARHHRQKAGVHPGCHRCEHFAVCQGACPLYWRAVGFGELAGVQALAPAPRGPNR